MAHDEGFARMLALEYVEAEPILKSTLLQRAPGYGVSGETLEALKSLDDRRYDREELERLVADRGGG